MKATPISRLRRIPTCFFVVLVSVVCHNGICFAFSDGDFQFWNTVGASFDVNKDWSVAVEEQLKFGNDAGHLYYQHTDLGFTYKSFADWIDIGFNYKQVFLEQRDGNWSRENRPHLNITFKGRLGTLDFSDRSRFEYRDKEYGDDLWRYLNKLEVNPPNEFTRFKFRPYVADQVYINMDGSGFEKNRIYVGVTFELSEDIESELYYVWESSKYFGRWQDLSALGLQLKFRF
jgi:hypothetical protein